MFSIVERVSDPMGRDKKENAPRRGVRLRRGDGLKQFPRPADFLSAVQKHANQELRLDWRRLARREPPMWPGSLYLWTLEHQESENLRLREFSNPAQSGSLLFFGTNACGIVFALDRRGAVHIFDEIEAGDVDCGVALAPSFAVLLSSAHVDESAVQRRVRLMRYWRRAPAMWRRLEAVVVKADPGTGELSGLSDLREWAVDLGKKDAFNESLERLGGRMSRPFKTSLRTSGLSFLVQPID